MQQENIHQTGDENVAGDVDQTKNAAENTTPENQNPDKKHGSGPSGHIPDGGAGGELKQPKENTGKDSNMGGAGGGTAGLGNSKEKTEETGE